MITPDEHRLLIADASAGNTKAVYRFLHSKSHDCITPILAGTALAMASAFGLVDVDRELLKRDEVDVNAKDNGDKTPLISASAYNRASVVRELLKRDEVVVNHTCHDGNSALQVASEKGHVEVVRELVKDERLDVNSRGRDC